jgi:hypothetical protein
MLQEEEKKLARLDQEHERLRSADEKQKQKKRSKEDKGVSHCNRFQSYLYTQSFERC